MKVATAAAVGSGIISADLIRIKGGNGVECTTSTEADAAVDLGL
jgi:hypothetical protein